MFALLTQQLDKNTTVPSHCYSLSRVWVFLELGLILSPGVSSMLGAESLSVHMLQTTINRQGSPACPKDPRTSTHVCDTPANTPSRANKAAGLHLGTRRQHKGEGVGREGSYVGKQLLSTHKALYPNTSAQIQAGPSAEPRNAQSQVSAQPLAKTTHSFSLAF